MGITVRSIKDGEGGGRPMLTSLGARPVAALNGRRILVFVADHG